MTILAAMSGTWARSDEHGSVFGEQETRAIESIARDYLIRNPDVILRSLEALQAREDAAKAEQIRLSVRQNREALERDPNSPVGGNPEGDVTVVEFFDYRCPYCKRVAPDVEQLLASDGNIRLVYKEWPILGPESVFAARAALAAREQGRYLEFHERVMNQQQVTERSVIDAAEDLGLDVDRLRADMEAPAVTAHLETTMELANLLEIGGTPAFVIGDQLLPGAASLDRLRSLVEDARSRTVSQ